MIGKLLLTALVLTFGYLVLRTRAGRRASSPTPVPAAPGPVSQPMIRWLAYGLLGSLLVGSGLFVFLEWQDRYRVVTVQVINSATGAAVTYRARRGDVELRGFTTVDGRRVVLAEVERLEFGRY